MVATKTEHEVLPESIAGHSSTSRHPYSGKRFAIVLSSWCLAGVGVVLSAVTAVAVFSASPLRATEALFLIPLFAWVALAVMSVRWIQHRRCHWLWPALGTLSGVLSAGAFAPLFFLYVAAVPLATYLVFWHLRLHDGMDLA